MAPTVIAEVTDDGVEVHASTLSLPAKGQMHPKKDFTKDSLYGRNKGLALVLQVSLQPTKKKGTIRTGSHNTD